MKEKNPQWEEREEFRELLKKYENFKNGQDHSFIEEESFEKIIEYYQEKEDFSSAMEAAEIGGDQFPYSSALLVKKADILLSFRKYQEALNILEHASLLDGTDINVYILKTDAYLALDQQEKAVELLEEALHLFEGEEKIELLFELSDVYDDYEDFDKVFDCLRMILRDEPNNEEALYKICFWTDFTGRNEESIRLHQFIIDEYPYNELAWFNLAAAYQGLKLYEKAIDAYQYAITIDEKFDYAYRNMGDAYIRLRKYREAIEVLEKVHELAKPEDVIFEAIGYCYDKMRNYAQARFHYRKALHLRQDDSKLYFKIASTYFNEERWESCIRQLEGALKIHKLQPEFNMLMGEAKMKQDLFKEAVPYFLTAVRARKRNLAAWESLIRCLYLGGFYEEALVQCTEAMQATSGKPVFYFYSASILFAQGRSKDALLLLQEGMSLSTKPLKKFVELNPSILQNQQVVDLIAKYKHRK